MMTQITAATAKLLNLEISSVAVNPAITANPLAATRRNMKIDLTIQKA
jgi:hypothetical protein